MPEIGGIDVGRKLRELGGECELIILTTSDDMFFDSIEIGAYQYIKKNDLSPAFFEELFIRVYCYIQDKVDGVFTFLSDNKPYTLPLNEIYSFEENIKGITTVTTCDQCYDFDSVVNLLTERLDNYGFHRLNANSMVNLNHVKDIEDEDIIFSNDETLAVDDADHSNLVVAWLDYKASKAES
jgi:DNA-binding LytR/AlgR family response regulator